MKTVYVSTMHGIRRHGERSGWIQRLDRGAERHRFALWVRSLLAIYDFDDFVGLDVPWWSFRSTDATAAFLSHRPDARVFEWGSGASTVWLAQRARSVTTIENDPVWAAKITAVIPGNGELRVIPGSYGPGRVAGAVSARAGYEGVDFSDYVASIDNTDALYDLIVVDGRARGACLTAALDHLAPDGMIVFDNVDRRRNRRAVRALGPRFHVRTLRGLTPCLPYPTSTAVITHRVPA